MSSEGPFSNDYILPPEPRFYPGLPGDGERAPAKKNIPMVTLYDGKRWEELSAHDKLQYARAPGPQEQLFYVKLRLVPAGATIATYREFEDVVSVKYEDHWMFIFDKTGHWTFPRERVIEVETTRQP